MSNRHPFGRFPLKPTAPTQAQPAADAVAPPPDMDDSIPEFFRLDHDDKPMKPSTTMPIRRFGKR